MWDRAGAEGDVDVRVEREDPLPLGLRVAPADRDHLLRVGSFQRRRLRKVGGEALVGLLPHGAGVEDNDIRLLLAQRLAEPDRLEQALDALRVVRIHLAAEGGDVVAAHVSNCIGVGLTSYFANSVARRLPDDGHLDLTRVLQLALDLAGDLVREEDSRVVVDLGRLDHDPDLPARLKRIDPFDALLRRRDLLERLEALDVVLQALAARTRARGRDSVGGDHQHGLHGLRLHFVVVSLDRMHDVLGLAELLRHAAPR